MATQRMGPRPGGAPPFLISRVSMVATPPALQAAILCNTIIHRGEGQCAAVCKQPAACQSHACWDHSVQKNISKMRRLQGDRTWKHAQRRSPPME